MCKLRPAGLFFCFDSKYVPRGTSIIAKPFPKKCSTWNNPYNTLNKPIDTATIIVQVLGEIFTELTCQNHY